MSREDFEREISDRRCSNSAQPIEDTASAASRRKPDWLKVRAGGGERFHEVEELLKEYHLHTVCREANCPNRGECYSQGTATFLIMGPHCARNCRFCNVTHGALQPLDPEEPSRIARAVSILGLRHAVITSVTRDDLADGGAAHFAAVIKSIRNLKSDITVEVLTPDFRGDLDALEIVLAQRPDVFNHNVETVPRLYPQVRPQADYLRSLAVLRASSGRAGILVKSGLMLGLGEDKKELQKLFIDLSRQGVQLLTIGQYLAPSRNHFPVAKYYAPEEFEKIAALARRSGIKEVFAGPLVRSSYHAAEQFYAQ
ncbi:MAG: lipoyl synthase [bacterium]|jgi:lipoic acid synthetase